VLFVGVSSPLEFAQCDIDVAVQVQQPARMIFVGDQCPRHGRRALHQHDSAMHAKSDLFGAFVAACRTLHPTNLQRRLHASGRRSRSDRVRRSRFSFALFTDSNRVDSSYHP
jgi:hypothetical protein